MAFAVFIIAAFVVSIWAAMRAKPLGDLPYHWATFVAVGAILSSPSTLVSAVMAFASGHVFGGLIFVLITVLSVWCCIGLLQRKRIGVVVYAVAWAMEILSRPFLEITSSHPFLQTIKINPPSLSELAAGVISFRFLISVVITVIPAILTYIYFKRRWRLMDHHEV